MPKHNAKEDIEKVGNRRKILGIKTWNKNRTKRGTTETKKASNESILRTSIRRSKIRN
jgi:hypothetical protein